MWDKHTLGGEGFWWFWYGSIGPSQPKKPSFRFKSHRLRITEQRTFAQAWWPTRNNEGCQYEVMTCYDQKKYPNKTNGLIDIDTWEFFGAVEAPGVLSYGLTTALIFFIPDEFSEIWQRSCWPFTSESKFEPGIRMQQGPIWHPYLLILFVGPFLRHSWKNKPWNTVTFRLWWNRLQRNRLKPPSMNRSHVHHELNSLPFSATLSITLGTMRIWHGPWGDGMPLVVPNKPAAWVYQLRWSRWWGVHNFARPRL